MVKSFVSTACRKAIMSKTLMEKYRTLFHEDNKLMPRSNSPSTTNSVNTAQTVPQQNPINIDKAREIPLAVNKIKNTSSENPIAFLQVLSVKISNENKSVTVNALFIQD